MSVQFDPHADFLACGMRDTSINVYNMDGGHLHKQINKPDPRENEIRDTGLLDVKYPVTSMRWIPDLSGEVGYDTLLASYANSNMKFWDISMANKDYEIDERDNLGIYSVDYSQIGDKIISGGADRSVRMYCNNTKKLINEMKGCVNNEILHHYNRIHCVKFGEDDNTAYSGGTDCVVSIHDTRQQKPVHNIEGPYIIGDTLDFKDNELLTGSYRSKNCIEIWDMRTFNRICSQNWDEINPKEGGQVVSAKFSNRKPGSVIAASKLTNEVKIFDREFTDTLATADGFKSMIYSMDQSHNGENIAVGTADGLVTVMEFH